MARALPGKGRLNTVFVKVTMEEKDYARITAGALNSSGSDEATGDGASDGATGNVPCMDG